jgi:1-acyl-sn-glycerol-3-phosphate acyltransferase
MPDLYQTPTGSPGRRRAFPSAGAVFYSRATQVIVGGSLLALLGLYSTRRWEHGSRKILQAAERAGGRITIENLGAYARAGGPCVVIANHMSTLETFLLPGMLNPLHPVTFVVKKSLTSYPIFGPVMRFCDPVTVNRKNPREDLQAVLSGGLERLKAGKSLVVFPQSTRLETFDPERFNSIGLKLAERAGVPVVPLALRTDFWPNGTVLKDFGPIQPERPIHFRFAEPQRIPNRQTARQMHQDILEFIQKALHEWGC